MQKSLLKKLYYENGFSLNEIAQYCKVSANKVSYWMDKYKLQCRTRSEALYQKNNRSGDPFSMKTDLSYSEMFSMGLGLGLFWGEGMKLSKNGVRLGNTDPYIILYFRDFLENICGVSRNKLKYSLQLFGDVDAEKARIFWTDILQISNSSLGKISVVKLRGTGSYKRKNKLGVLQIACYNKKLKEVIDNLIRTLKLSQYAVVAQSVERVHGETPETFAQLLRN